MKFRNVTMMLLAMTFAVVWNPLFAQEARPLTLAEAIDLAVQNSSLLKRNKAVAAEAAAAIKETQNNRLPDVSFSGSYLYLPVAPNIKTQLKTGDSTGMGGGGKVSQAMYGMASASLPIYAGGSIKYGLQSAQFLEQAARLDVDENREALIFNAIDAFANLYKAKLALAIVNENLLQAQQRVKDFSNLEKNGLLPRNDLLKAELQASNAELSVLDADNNYRLANTNMTIMLGLPRQTLLAPDAAGLQQNIQLKTLEDYEQLAVQNRKDIEALSYRKRAAGLGIKSAKAAYYPSVALTGGYAAVDVPNLLSATNIINLGVGLKYSLSSLWKTDAKVQRAKAVEQQLAANETLLRENVELQINRVYQNYLLSNKKIEVYAKALEQAVENYKITKNKYDNSLATTTDLLDADVAQLQARLNYTLSKTDAVVAYNKLQQTAGLLYNKQ